MSRPRIRTVKPEMRQDESYGLMSRDARELFNGLITFCDDDGRFRALPAMILGHVFPYDDDAPRKLSKWMKEVEASGLVVFYVVEGVRYGCIPTWHKHQNIDRYAESRLPSPPKGVDWVTRDEARSRPKFVESSSKEKRGLDESSTPPAQAGGSLVPLPVVSAVEEPTTLECRKLCNHLAQKIRHRDPKAKVAPDSPGWLADMDKLLRIDERTPQEVAAIIDWAQASDFWAANILSPGKLRKQFSTLTIQAQGSRPTAGSEEPRGPNGVHAGALRKAQRKLKDGYIDNRDAAVLDQAGVEWDRSAVEGLA